MEEIYEDFMSGETFSRLSEKYKTNIEHIKSFLFGKLGKTRAILLNRSNVSDKMKRNGFKGHKYHKEINISDWDEFLWDHRDKMVGYKFRNNACQNEKKGY